LNIEHCKKYGFKSGDGPMDYVDYVILRKSDILKEIQTYGTLTNFTEARKEIESSPGDDVFFFVDKEMKFGQMILLCYTEDSRDFYWKEVQDKLAAIEAQRLEEAKIEDARRAAEYARANVVYEDVPLSPRVWTSSTSLETENEVARMKPSKHRENISFEIARPKRTMKEPCNFSNRRAEIGGIKEFRSYKDADFIPTRELDHGFQVAPSCTDNYAQTTWYRPLNKAVQYESASVATDSSEDNITANLLDFLEKVTVKIENALQQNESVDIFHETFRVAGEDDAVGATDIDNELRDVKSFYDPTYAQDKSIAAIDWLPKYQGIIAVSVVDNVPFDQRILLSGQSNPAYILVWDFKQLVKPQVVMQCQHEVFTFRFNRTMPSIVAGGCITGQVALWDIEEPLMTALKNTNRGTGNFSTQNDENSSWTGAIMPKWVSNVDHSHKKCVGDLFWLPPNTQMNYKGQLVGPEHLDDRSHQFVTIAGDGMVLVWDTRFEKIAKDELKHIGRTKHVPQEKLPQKDGGQKPLWAPIFRAHLKRLEEVGELSLCRCSYAAQLKYNAVAKSSLTGDVRAHLMIGTEEGDIIFADLSSVNVRKQNENMNTSSSGVRDDDDDEAEGGGGRDFVRWITVDHARPVVAFQHSPFFADIMLTVSDWRFHIWKVKNHFDYDESLSDNLF
jgi:hypothetical protein